MYIFIIGCIFLELANVTRGAVRPPPWADPDLNPCASQPRGWQYLFWPDDGQCYKIFQIGYPCPETMELVPGGMKSPGNLKAECRCPPSSALHKPTGRCYELFKRGPCDQGQYFRPQKDINNNDSFKTRIGTCEKIEICQNADQIFWPANRKCYKKFSQGPCPKGELLGVDNENMTVCSCLNDNNMKQFYWEPTKSCYEHFTKGPCLEKGHLFLPDRFCDCHPKLPHYHQNSQQCYELESRGPCKQGHEFIIDETINTTHATCKCKLDHVKWPSDGKCYRPFTQGPCPPAQILANSTTCISIPCGRGFLYFPEQQTCYRIGSQGPCPIGQIVTFDFRTRPSIDGISYNGICGCTGLFNDNNCLKEKRSARTCEPGTVLHKNKCYRLYLQGPCVDGQWLVPNRQSKTNKNTARCDCKPGFKAVFNDGKLIQCLAPSVGIANYLNKHFFKLN